MPYKIVRDSRCEDGKPWGVVKEDDNKLMGCHESESKAQDQISALNAQESARGLHEAQGHISLTESEGAGVAEVKIIEAGKGDSAYYPADVLQRDGARVFKEGTKMYWDHPSISESWERPERSLRDLAGVLLSDARWQNDGLYAEARVFPPYYNILKEIKDYTGVSIRVLGSVKNESIDGVPVVDQLVEAQSVDFVTTPGAGGKVIGLFESARNNKGDDRSSTVDLQETVNNLNQEKTTLQTQLSEAQTAKTTLEKQLEESQQEVARLREHTIMSEAAAKIDEALANAALPDVTKKRIKESVLPKVSIVDNKLDQLALKATLEEAVKTEKEYIDSISGSNVRAATAASTGGNGNSGDDIDLTESFKKLGLSDEVAKAAANGRG